MHLTPFQQGLPPLFNSYIENLEGARPCSLWKRQVIIAASDFPPSVARKVAGPRNAPSFCAWE